MNRTLRLDQDGALRRTAWIPTSPVSAPLLPPTPDLCFGEFRLAGKIDLLFWRGEVVPLEPRAVQVLRVLALHRGEVVRKEILIDRVWLESFVTEGVLKKAISQIRRALGEREAAREWIETFHRRGYRLRAAAPRPVGLETAARPGPLPQGRGKGPVSPGYLRTSA